ncbi:DNA repair exonuclease [Brevibacillus nitrificans]|uniref:metallophosphoesterase family protein n=1 Tax=Brevibacillus nitrificans TaxID=651560 RepID=UPI0028551B87|nr:DNA repair exonuclease [Brevibacillus nitrificans]MDR7319005.1 DNA repair exonuclease SbcCD nuclease subunit [Brevibacillus nitrificans]
MLSFIHTADVHLDAPLHTLTDLFELRQDDFRKTMRGIRDLVLDRQVDFWLIAGDLLEYHGGRRSTALFLRDLFASISPVPVCISPGNHDPWRADSFYQTLEWPGNVHWFTPEWGAYEFPEKSCVVYGWGFPQPHFFESPLATFPGKLGGYQHHLMVLHASILSKETEEHHPYAPVALQELADTGMDYAALGHIHKAAQFLHPTKKSVFAAYPGSPEALNTKEQGERCVLYGEIDAAGKVVLESVPVGQRQMRRREISLEGTETMEQLIELLEEKLASERSEDMLYVTLTGERAAHFVPSTAVVSQRFSRFFQIHVTDQTWPDVDADKLMAEAGIWGKWLAKLAQREQLATDEGEREIIRLARREALTRIGGSIR